MGHEVEIKKTILVDTGFKDARLVLLEDVDSAADVSEERDAGVEDARLMLAAEVDVDDIGSVLEVWLA